MLVAAHEAGTVTLYVACDGYIISNSELFEFKVKDDPETKDSVPEWFSMTGRHFNL